MKRLLSKPEIWAPFIGMVALIAFLMSIHDDSIGFISKLMVFFISCYYTYYLFKFGSSNSLQKPLIGIHAFLIVIFFPFINMDDQSGAYGIDTDYWEAFCIISIILFTTDIFTAISINISRNKENRKPHISGQ